MGFLLVFFFYLIEGFLFMDEISNSGGGIISKNLTANSKFWCLCQNYLFTIPILILLVMCYTG